MRVVVSTYHLALKFLVNGRVGIVRGDQTFARECYVLATKAEQKAKVILVVYQIDDLNLPTQEILKILSELDSRDNGESNTGLVEDLEEVALDLLKPEKGGTNQKCSHWGSKNQIG